MDEKKINNNKTEEKKKKKEKIPVLRTFKTDASDFIRKENISMADVAVAQVNKKIPSGLEKEEHHKRVLLKKIAIFFAILVVFSGVIITIFYFIRDKEPKTPTIVNFPKSIILTEKEKGIDINNLKNEIRGILDYEELLAGETLSVPIVRDVNGIRETVSIKTFFDVLEIKTPIGLFDVLDDKFMYAVFNGFQSNPALILKLSSNPKSYENAFAAMLRWEKTIGKEFEKYFGFEGEDYDKNIFYDIEISNNDVRVLSSMNDNSVIMYSFINREYLVITTNENTLKEMLRRLSSVQYLND